MKSNKIIIRVKGGLGNQLFIYAFARSLSIKFEIPVYLDTLTGFLKNSYKRKYRLDNYNILLKHCSLLDSLYYPLNKRFKCLTKLIFGDTIYCTEHDFDTDFIQTGLNSYNKIYLDDYWQNEEYFKEYFGIIRYDLSVNFQISQKNKDLANQMESCNSVAVHFRRVQYDNVLELEYYENSIIQIKKQIDKPVFYIFSDDLDWCKEKLKLNEKLVFINHNTNDEISELWLMSQCKHFIIANSTFSWWGAALSSNKQKVIVAPTK